MQPNPMPVPSCRRLTQSWRDWKALTLSIGSTRDPLIAQAMNRDSHVAQRIVYDLELVVDDHSRPSLRIECGPKRDLWIVRVSRAGEGHPGFAYYTSQRLLRTGYWTHD